MTHPNAQKALDEVRQRFRSYNDGAIFRHCIHEGSRIHMEHDDDPNMDEIRRLADKLARHTIVVAIDTEHFTLNSDEMTELGIAMFERQNMVNMQGGFGDHGVNLMRKFQYHFFRLREKAHLPTTNERSKGPEGNRFGEVRFVSFKDMRQILTNVIRQRVKGDPELEGFPCPIVILGHSVGHDCEHVNGKDLAFNIEALGTVVGYVDTQKMSKQLKLWTNEVDDIGLNQLCAKLSFEHRDAHTASNDAARALICAMRMALPPSSRQGCQHSMQEVADHLEACSQQNFTALGGTTKYCIRCATPGHMKGECTRTDLSCEECVSRGLTRLARDHVSLHCLVVTHEVKSERLWWYEEQIGQDPVTNRKITKIPFKSRLQTFAEGAVQVAPASSSEVNARRQHYANQTNLPADSLRHFVWPGRSFKSSPYASSRPTTSQGGSSYGAPPSQGSNQGNLPFGPGRGGTQPPIRGGRGFPSTAPPGFMPGNGRGSGGFAQGRGYPNPPPGSFGRGGGRGRGGRGSGSGN